MNDLNVCSSYFTAGSGDEMDGAVGSQEVINGTTGNKFYTLLRDYSNGVICEWAYPDPGVNFDHQPYGKEYFADFFAERPQIGSTSNYYRLPVFGNSADSYTFTFYDCGMITEAQGAYTYYNLGYGFASYMLNAGTTNTSLGGMNQNGGGSSYGYFSETWDNSAGT